MDSIDRAPWRLGAKGTAGLRATRCLETEPPVLSVADLTGAVAGGGSSRGSALGSSAEVAVTLRVLAASCPSALPSTLWHCHASMTKGTDSQGRGCSSMISVGLKHLLFHLRGVFFEAGTSPSTLGASHVRSKPKSKPLSMSVFMAASAADSKLSKQPFFLEALKASASTLSKNAMISAH